MKITKPLIIANWKLNGNKQFIHNIIYPLINFFKEHSITSNIIILPPNLYIDYINNIIYKTNIFLGAQNVDINQIGAFTGETSILMLKDIGVQYILLGHSEVRTNHKENNLLIAKKFKLIKHFNCIPILCIGENKIEKNQNRTIEIIEKQLNKIFDICGVDAFNNSIIAYEPIWSIGTGVIPDLKYIQDIHKYIKKYIQKKIKNNLYQKYNFFVIYGGSVNEHNVKSIIKEKYIDGVLIGGSSLSYDIFSKIIKLININ